MATNFRTLDHPSVGHGRRALLLRKMFVSGLRRLIVGVAPPRFAAR
jgi:hypothetical protein